MKKNYFRIPLGILLDLGLINFSMKTDTKFSFTLQGNMNKIFESKKHRRYIAYQKFTLTQNFSSNSLKLSEEFSH